MVNRGIGRQAARVALLALVVSVSGCATRLAEVETFAQKAGFEAETVPGAGFAHRVLRRPGAAAGAALGVYLEGDGSPYRSPLIVNDDPTPRNPVMLRLMALDPGPAVYVGRPCYFGLQGSAGCNPLLWTLERFSEAVVESLTAVVQAEMARSGAARVRLFGHSGGGALAVLVARRLGPDVVSEVVTIAGNLDHDAWTTYHGYAPLAGSLNPVHGGALPAGIRQRHLAGAEDANIPPALMSEAAEVALGGRMEVVPGVRHTCCWEAIWKAVLAGSL